MAAKVMIVFGTRPEAIKMCPVILALKKERLDTVVCATGQHTELLRGILELFGITVDHDLSVMRDGRHLSELTAAVLQGMQKVLEQEHPDMVLVHGDTLTAFAATLSCYYQKISVGHVEAGLRTYDMYAPFPEEFNRQAVSLIADCHFAPTEWARNNLLAEGRKADAVYVTGNTVIDTFAFTVKKEFQHPQLSWAKGSRLILLTAHRRENLGVPMRRMFQGIRRIIEDFPDVKVIYPVHPNPDVRAVAEEVFADCPRVRLIEPLEVDVFHNFMAQAYFIVTDSGGIQEEAPFLGKPVIVMRTQTERPEAIHAGTVRLAGTSGDSVYEYCRRLLEDEAEYEKMSGVRSLYGDGHAGERIAKIIRNRLSEKDIQSAAGRKNDVKGII